MNIKIFDCAYRFIARCDSKGKIIGINILQIPKIPSTFALLNQKVYPSVPLKHPSGSQKRHSSERAVLRRDAGRHTSPDGGIGRRAGLKHQWSNPCRFDPGSGYQTKCKCLIFKHLHFSFCFLRHACTTKSAFSPH